MIEAIVALACVAGCVAIGASPLPSSDTIDPCGPRARAARRAEQRFAATLLVIAGGAFGSLLAASYGLTAPLVPLAIGCMVVLGLLHPWPLVRVVCIPLGMTRAASALTRLGGHPWMRDPEGGAILASVLAAGRRRNLGATTRRRLAAEIRGGALGGAGVVAAGLLAAIDGDAELARRLLDSVELLDPGSCPPLARSIALDWLVADAARRGAWREIDRRCETAASMSSTVALLHAVARRRLGRSEPAPSVLRRWLAAPRRWRTRAVLRRDEGPIRGLEVVEPIGLVAANDGGGIARSSVALHVETMVAGPTGAPEAVRRCAATWDATLWDFDFRRRLRRRVLGLDCAATVEEIVTALHRSICRDLAERIDPGAPPDRDDDTRTLRRATELRCQLAVQAIDAAGTALASAREHPVPPPTVDLWSACMRMRAAFETVAALAPADVARAVFAAIDVELGATAAWLWNRRREQGLASALCTWLVLQAERVRDQRAAEHHRLQAARLA